MRCCSSRPASWRLWIVAILLLNAPPVFAQSTATLTFTPSPDHAAIAQGVTVVDRYELVLTPSTGTAPAPLNLQKPVPSANMISVNVTTYLNSVPPGTYTAVVRAIGPGGVGASPPSPSFTLGVPVPGAPANPVILRSGGSPSPASRR
jgi:hypothetical protein